MLRRDYEMIARIVRTEIQSIELRKQVALAFAHELLQDDHRFNVQKFVERCMRDIIHQDGRYKSKRTNRDA